MTKEQATVSTIHKKPHVILCSVIVWGVLVIGVIWPWIHQLDRLDYAFSILAHVSAAIWWSVLLWALHHLAFQLAALFSKKTVKPRTSSRLPAIAVLYTTCDDFNPVCCQSCLDQDYENYRVLICDDSKLPKYKSMVRNFCAEHPSRCSLITRSGNQGFKAGNLNHAIENYAKEDWILLVDADQLLFSDYLSQFVARLPDENSNVAFVQAAHEAIAKAEHSFREESSPFQISLSPGVSLYYFRDLVTRESFGFVPLLGHGAMIRRSAWETLGKFPEIVSEDFAFALRAANNRLQGIYLEDVVSYEAFPYDFGGFMIRLKKFAGGTVELLRREVIAFLSGPAQVVEKWDLFMMVFWYVLMPLVVFNGFLGAYVCHRLWIEGLPYLHPVLPYLYSWMLLSILVLNISVTQGGAMAFRFYFWSTAIYTTAMPLAGLSFVKHLFSQPTFVRTPKNREEARLSVVESSFMVVLGSAAMICALAWISPFSPLLAGQGIAYLSYPLYGKLCSDSLLGRFSRMLVNVPGILMLFALYAMWKWGRF